MYYMLLMNVDLELGHLCGSLQHRGSCAGLLVERNATAILQLVPWPSQLAF